MDFRRQLRSSQRSSAQAGAHTGVPALPGPGGQRLSRGHSHHSVAGHTLFRPHAFGGASGYSRRTLQRRRRGRGQRYPEVLSRHRSVVEKRHLCDHPAPHNLGRQLGGRHFQSHLQRPGLRHPDFERLYFQQGNSLNLGYAATLSIMLTLVLATVAVRYLKTMFRNQEGKA